MIARLDKPLLVITALLAAMGLVAIHITAPGPSLFRPNGWFIRQAVWIVLGLAAMNFVARVPFSALLRYTPWIYAGGIILLSAVLFFPPTRGARSWIALGPLHLQPSELMKPCLILGLAFLLSSSESFDLRSGWRRYLLAVAAALLPLILILKEPDLGTAISVSALISGVFFAAGLPLRWVLLASAAGGLLAGRIIFSIADKNLLLFAPGPARTILHDRIGGLAVLASLTLAFCVYPLLKRRFRRSLGFLLVGLLFASVYAVSFEVESRIKPYQERRILTFVKPDVDPRGASYNVLQSMIAIGAGGGFGRGPSHASQIALGFLPERHTDFIFSVVCEAFGFLGGSAVLVLYALLIHRILLIGRRAVTRAGGLAAAGAGALFLCHLAINAGMAEGIVPVIGIPLTLLSYGGSAMLSAFLTLGIIHAIAAERRDSICG